MKVADVDLGLCPAAQRIHALSLATWGPDRAVEIVGCSPGLVSALATVEKIASFQEPVLITGETGTGKEGLAQALYLLGDRRGLPMVSVNCPQYLEGNLTVSELFGHRRGSFTGASADRKGCFETANGGVIFLDEISDLHMSAQVMLLRALAQGEFQPLGSDTTTKVNVRVLAATNRPPEQLGNAFRNDLYFRLRYFLVKLPPLRERGDDWRLLVERTLQRLHAKYGVEKRISSEALALLEPYTWPGNVRELVSLVTTGYALADGASIEPHDIVSHLVARESRPVEEESPEDEIYRRLVIDGESFWHAVYTPFMERSLNRRQVTELVRRGLLEGKGSYRALLDVFHVPSDDYQRFMDFLRHHDLKP